MSKIRDALYRWSARRLKKIYGDYEPWQYPAYRCKDCQRLITWRQIRKGPEGFCRCGGKQLRPALLNWHEEIRLLFFSWTLP